MAKSQESLDGFVPRRASVSLNESLAQTNGEGALRSVGDIESVRPEHEAMPNFSSLRDDLNSSLEGLNVEEPGSGGNGKREKGGGRRFLRRKRKEKKPQNKRKKIIKRVIILIVILLLGLGGFMAYKALSAAGSIFKGNPLSLLLPDTPLKTDQYGNTNLLILGTSESDPGHPGAQLTDSMMVASINQKTHQVFLVSVPRDLWVTYDQSCSVGDAGKINAVYECSLGSNLGGISQTQNDEQTAENAVASKVGEVFGTDIQYVAHLNLAVVQKVVDAVGGIDITIDSPDPRGILDRNFDWRCNYTCYLVKYPNGPAHLDGTQAMWLVQARNDSGGYGLPRGNFDREENQRKVLTAVKDKAMSVGFLANPINVANFLDALGSNVHTTINSSEIKSFIDAIKAVPSNGITSIDIQQQGPNVLTTGTGPDGSSIVEPTAGLEDYSGIQVFMKELLQGGAPVISEQATVDVLNGSGTAGVAQQTANDLATTGVTIGTVDDAPSGNYPHYTLYDLSKGSKPKSLAALKSKLGISSVQTSLPSGVSSTASFVVIVGPDQSSSNSSSSSN